MTSFLALLRCNDFKSDLCYVMICALHFQSVGLSVEVASNLDGYNDNKAENFTQVTR